MLYMHDGQNLFNQTIAFARTDWSFGEVIVHLYRECRIRPVIPNITII